MEKVNTGTLTVNVDGTEYQFYPCKEHGCFYEVGCTGQVGEFFIPMNADGTPDLYDGPCTIEVTWENA